MKMKLILFLACASLVYATDDLQNVTKVSDEGTDFYEEVKELFGKQCEKKIGPEGPKKLSKALEGLTTCISDKLPKNKEEFKNQLDASVSSSEELCAEPQSEMLKCFEGLVNVLEECSDEEEKYMPKFLFESLQNIYDYICNNEMEAIKKVFALESFECISLLAEKSEDLDQCIDNIEAFKDDRPEEQLLTKAETCRSLSKLKDCSSNFITKTCPTDTRIITFTTGLFDAIRSPCLKGSKNPADIKLLTT